MLERLKWLVAGKELQALHRYRMACALAWRWNGQVPNSSETAEWISQVGEDQRGADISEFRARLGSADKAIEHDRTQDALPAVPDGWVSREVLRNLIDDEIASWSKSDKRREVTHAMACLIQRLAATQAHDQPEGADNG